MTKSRNVNKWIGYSGAFAFAAIFMVGCVSDVKKAEDGEEAKTAEVDSSATKLMTIGGSMFSIPSPIQTAMLIEKSGADYSNIDRKYVGFHFGGLGADAGTAGGTGCRRVF